MTEAIRRQYAIQALLGDETVHTCGWVATREAAEESGARLVAINGALCWLVERDERVTHTEWRPAA